MVHQFDPAAKAYVTGEGKSQVWRPLDWHEKHLVPHFFVSRKLFTALLPEQVRFRAGFLEMLTLQDKRAHFANFHQSHCSPCGNTVPAITFHHIDEQLQLLWVSLANSFE
jgi:hypothetical protein